MKIAVCMFGICRGNVKKNIDSLKHHFPYDYFFGTWKGREKDIEKLLPNVDYVTTPEPNMHYHPIIDVHTEYLLSPKLKAYHNNFKNGVFNQKMKERTLHHTKQLLGHAYILSTLPEEYDMIVRARFDTYVTKSVNLQPYLNRSYNEKKAIGFGTRTSRHKNINILKEVPQLYPDGKDDNVSQDWGWYIMDPLILHRRDMFDLALVKKLHQEKKLLVAENGWYQILSQPFNDNHISVYGGAQIEKYLNKTQI